MFVCLLCLWFIELSRASPVAVVNGRLSRRNCYGGHRHGAVVDMPMFWYYCDDGIFVNKGCFTTNRKRLGLGDKDITDGIEVRCDEDPAGNMHLRHTGCVWKGRLYNAEDTWEEAGTNLWYHCENTGRSLKLHLSGCVVAGTKRIRLGETIVFDDVVYKCHNHTDDGVDAHLQAIGCMHWAKQYPVGQTFNGAQYFYSCTLSKDGVHAGKHLLGCLHSQKRLFTGDRYEREGVVYECVVAGTTAMHMAVGCVTEDRGRKEVGERWTVGHAPYRYQLQCLPNDEDDESGTIVESVACAYVDEQDNEVIIEVGCYDIIGDNVVACKRREEDQVLIYTVFTAAAESHAAAFGVKKCEVIENPDYVMA